MILGCTYKVSHPEHTYYVTINTLGDGRPFEVFVNSSDTHAMAELSAITRLLSALFRMPGELDLNFIHEELCKVPDPHGGWWGQGWMTGVHVRSLPAAIGLCLRHFMGGQVGKKEPPTGQVGGGERKEESSGVKALCPKCGENAMQKLDGCETCLSCGYSKCG